MKLHIEVMQDKLDDSEKGNKLILKELDKLRAEMDETNLKAEVAVKELTHMKNELGKVTKDN